MRGRSWAGYLIRGAEDVRVVLLEAPQPGQASQGAGGLGPVKGPKVCQSQGQLPPGSGPVGEHQAEIGVGRVSGTGEASPEDCLLSRQSAKDLSGPAKPSTPPSEPYVTQGECSVVTTDSIRCAPVL